MQKLRYENEQINQLSDQSKNLGELLQKIENQLSENGQIVCRFIVNDLVMTENDEKKYSEVALKQVEKIEVEYETPAALINSVVLNWVDSIPKMIFQADGLVQKFRKTGFENNMKEFVNLVDSCQFLIESLISLRTICQDVPQVGNADWKVVESLTARAISEALDAFEKKDFVLLSDILEYDLGHCLQRWLETLVELEKYVQQKTFSFVGQRG